MRLPGKDNILALIEADKESRFYASQKYYSGFFRIPYLARLKMALRLLPGRHEFNRLLDAGCGSGIFLPELSRHCARLFAIDSHRFMPLVDEMLRKEEIQSRNLRADMLKLPFKDKSFDCIVCLSVLESIDDTDQVLSEMLRVADDNAAFIIGIPALNKITDFCYEKIAKSKYHRLLHKSGHEKVFHSMRRYLDIERVLKYPYFFPFGLSLFFVLKARKKRGV